MPFNCEDFNQYLYHLKIPSLAPRPYCGKGDCDYCLNEHCCHRSAWLDGFKNGFNNACCVNIAKRCAGPKGGSNENKYCKCN